MAYHDYDYSTYDLETGQMKIIAGALAGLVVGGLVGAALMLIYAPQSGAKTRKLIRKRAMALRNQATETAEEARERAEEALDSALERARDATDEVRERVEHIQKRGQKTLEAQRERVASVVDAGREKILRR